MNKVNNLIICVALSLITSLTSCHRNNSNQISIDFGKGEYEEPFLGLLKSQPEFLRKTLDWPIFRSLKSDTVTFIKVMEIDFNEDALRSHSTAKLLFKDTLNKDLNEYIQIYCNDTLLTKGIYTIIADEPTKLIRLKVRVMPQAGDITQVGNITITAQELDVVNGIPLSTDFIKIGEWTFTQDIGWPMMIWIFWFLILVLVIAIIVLLCIGLYYFGIFSWPYISSFFSSLKPSLIFNRIPINKTKTGSSGKPTDYYKLCHQHINVVKLYEKKLHDKHTPCSEKAQILEEMRSYLEKIKEDNGSEINQQVYDSLHENTQSALDKLNKEVWGPIPNEGKNGKWINNSDGSYTFQLSTNHKYYPDCQELGMTQCKYSASGEPQFDKATQNNTIVEISDLYDKYTQKELSARGGGSTFDGSFQAKAQERIADRILPEIKEEWDKYHPYEPFNKYKAFFEWRDRRDLVPHEDANCKTLRLVKRSVHKAFTHSGGISRICIIKDYF